MCACVHVCVQFTRNSPKAVDFLMQRTGFRFCTTLSREFRPFKPAPDGALHIARTVFGVAPEECIFVGDSVDDLKCGRAAGMATALLDEDRSKAHLHPLADIVVSSIGDLPALLTAGFATERGAEPAAAAAPQARLVLETRTDCLPHAGVSE